MNGQIIIRLVRQGEVYQPRATIRFINRLPDNFWEDYALPFLTGEKQFGKAKRVLTVNIIQAKRNGAV